MQALKSHHAHWNRGSVNKEGLEQVAHLCASQFPYWEDPDNNNIAAAAAAAASSYEKVKKENTYKIY